MATQIKAKIEKVEDELRIGYEEILVENKNLGMEAVSLSNFCFFVKRELTPCWFKSHLTYNQKGFS